MHGPWKGEERLGSHRTPKVFPVQQLCRIVDRISSTFYRSLDSLWPICWSAGVTVRRSGRRCEPERAPLRVAVLLSGGVDSSLALRLLQAAGHAVTAFYLQIWFQEDFRNSWGACPWEEDLAFCTQVRLARGRPGHGCRPGVCGRTPGCYGGFASRHELMAPRTSKCLPRRPQSRCSVCL